jgi:predicted DNA-binding transcriptional regulator AlpA
MKTERLLRLPDVCDRVALKKAGVYKAIREGRCERWTTLTTIPVRADQRAGVDVVRFRT